MAVLLAAPALSAAADITTGLVAYYPLNGNALDVSGNGRDGTIIGASATSDRYGNSNAAMGFDGNDYIVASAAGLPTGARTVALWFRLNALASSRPFPVPFAYGGCSCGTSWFEMVAPTGMGVGQHCNAPGLWCSYNVSTGVWYHLVFTMSDPGGTAMYVNGQFVCSSPAIMNTCTTGAQLAIGVCVNAWAGQAPFTNVDVDYTNGAIDEVRIYDRALSATEVQALFDFNPTATDPVTWGAIKALYR